VPDQATFYAGEDKASPTIRLWREISETTKGHAMGIASQELTLSSALSDPLIRTLMTADKVDPTKLESMLRRIAQELKPGLSPSTKAGHGCWA
jgi:hypothetical protein